jgi:hypothetical protein
MHRVLGVKTCSLEGSLYRGIIMTATIFVRKHPGQVVIISVHRPHHFREKNTIVRC